MFENECIGCRRFHHPLTIEERVTIEVMTVRAEQIICFPVCDMKQQNILVGICNNSCTYACPNCICARSNFHEFPPDLWSRIYPDKECPFEVKPLREGEWDPHHCYQRYNVETMNGEIKQTQNEQKETSRTCASVKNRCLWSFEPGLNDGDPLHISAGHADHFYGESRKKIRDFEAGGDFASAVSNAVGELEALLDSLAFSEKDMKDKNANNVMIRLHRESRNLRKKYREKMAEIQRKRREVEAEDSDCEEFEEFFDDDGSEEEQCETELEEVITQLSAEAQFFRDAYTEHATESHYGHYVQLNHGCTTFMAAIKRYQAKSKRPKGKLEYVFTKAIEQRGIGNGKYMAEHSGYEQTNGNALKSLENFDKIVKVCISACDTDACDVRERLKEMMATFNDVAKKLLRVCLLLKSQKKCDPDEFDTAVADYASAYLDTFDGKSFNKLHFLIAHITSFVREYKMIGRASAESHEAGHAYFSRIKRLIKTKDKKKMFSTFYSRIYSTLDPKLTESRNKIKSKTTGKKRGPYRITTRVQEDVDFNDAHFAGEYEVDGETFLKLHEGGSIPEKYKSIYLYVVHGRAPADWTTCFDEVLPAVERNEARFSRH